MPQAPIIRSRTSSQSGGSQSAATLPALRVRYYRCMRPNKVYPVQVSWKGTRKGSPEATGPVHVRLIMAGTQVVPSEQQLDPGEPAATVTFYVTPLARGRLGGERAEVIQNGRKIAEVRTPAKVVTQRFTLWLLLLTFLVPWLLVNYFAHELKEEVAGKNKNTKTTLRVGEALEHQIRHITPEVLPPVHEYAADQEHYLTDIPQNIGAYYTVLFFKYRDNPAITSYIFWGLLLLTLLSYLWHGEKRRTRVGQPIEVEP